MIIHGQRFKNDTVTEVGKFAILWNVFENIRCDKRCGIDKLKAISKRLHITEPWTDLAVAFRERAKKREVYLDIYVDEHLAMGNGIQEDFLPLVKDFIQNPTNQNLIGGLVAIYRIRNNMFHGLKEWDDLDNQIELFKAMNAVLESIL